MSIPSSSRVRSRRAPISCQRRCFDESGGVADPAHGGGGGLARSEAVSAEQSGSDGLGKNLPVPGRSQGLPEYKGKGYGGGGEVWCSPTSTSMVLEYWSQVLSNPSLNQTVPDAAAGCYDWV